MKTALLLVVAAVGLSGCVASSPNCVGKMTLSASPIAATADHAAASPGNRQKFTVTDGETVSGMCAIPNVLALVHPTWTNPDPLDISISSANDATNGIAVCTSSTSGPVTLTGSVATPAGKAGVAGQLSVSVQLTCK